MTIDISSKKKVSVASLVIAICALCLLRPWFLWGMTNIVQFGVFPVMYLAAIIPNMDLRRGNNVVMFLSFVALLLLTILLKGNNFSFSIAILSLSVIPFVKENILRESIRCFEILLAVFLLGGLIFLLMSAVGVHLPSQTIAPLNEAKMYNYTLYPPFLVVPNSFFDFARFCGPFDEPGVVGTVATFVLFVEKYDLKKWYVAVCFVAAIFSFSFFFVVCSLFWFAFRIVKKPFFGILIVIMAFGFYGMTKDVPVLDEMLYSRFEINQETGMLSGDNRSSEAQMEYFDRIRWTEIYFWGSKGKETEDFTGTRGFRDAILNYGVVFCFLYFLWFYFYARNKKLSLLSTLVFMTILLGNFYQRPNLLSFPYIYLNVAFATSWRLEELQRKRESMKLL